MVPAPIRRQRRQMSEKESTARDADVDKEDKKGPGVFKYVNLSRFRAAFLHVALLFACTGYIVIGAMIFVKLERPYELMEREATLRRIDTLMENLLSLNGSSSPSSSLSSSSSEHSHSPVSIETAIDDYTRQIFEIIGKPHGSHVFNTHFVNPTDDKDMWTLASAVLFTSTTVIPVGYGYIAPISPVARVFCVIYGMIGIPLVLVTMADAGKFMSNFITKFFTTSLTVPTIIFLTLLFSYPIVGGFFFHFMADLSFMDAIYFSLISIFTIGFGDLAPSVNVIYLVLFIVVGVILVTITIDFVAAELIDHVHYMGRHVGKAKELAGRMFSLAQSINMNKGLSVGMTQLHALARFGMLGKVDVGALNGTRVRMAFEPSLDDVDYMDCGASRDLR